MILVYGFYGKEAFNVGDLLFKEAFQHLFPNCQFNFVDFLDKKSVIEAEAIFFGGGSFLYTEPRLENGVLDILLTKKLFYIGVGVENIHHIHQKLIKKAQIVAIRNENGLEKAKLLNSRAILIPDLVYSLPANQTFFNKKSILVIPNIEVVPNRESPHFMHTSWAQFKSEFSQFLDEKINQGYNLTFMSMCSISNLKDIGAMYEIINMMKNKKYSYVEAPQNIFDLTQMFSMFESIITQRYHGIVLSEICQRSCISIAHHDKLKNKLSNGTKIVSYYGLEKSQLHDFYNENILPTPINLNSFEELISNVSQLL